MALKFGGVAQNKRVAKRLDDVFGVVIGGVPYFGTPAAIGSRIGRGDAAPNKGGMSILEDDQGKPLQGGVPEVTLQESTVQVQVFTHAPEDVKAFRAAVEAYNAMVAERKKAGNTVDAIDALWASTDTKPSAPKPFPTASKK